MCYENKEEKLLADLAMHQLDVVLTDSPVRRGFKIKAYNHFLGECGVTFFAVRKIANSFRRGFPKSLDKAPMLLPLDMTAVRQGLEVFFESLEIRPMIVGEFEDSALLKEFGQNGGGIFAAPSVVEKQIQGKYNVDVVGRSDAVRERFYAISFERIIRHPAVTAIADAALQSLFIKKRGASMTRNRSL